MVVTLKYFGHWFWPVIFIATGHQRTGRYFIKLYFQCNENLQPINKDENGKIYTFAFHIPVHGIDD